MLLTSAHVRGLSSPTCPVCGTPTHACGDSPEVHPIDDPFHSTLKGPAMTEPEELGVYTYKVYDNEVTGQLSKADAERLGATPVDDGDGGDEGKPSSKARKTANKAVTTPDE